MQNLINILNISQNTLLLVNFSFIKNVFNILNKLLKIDAMNFISI